MIVDGMRENGIPQAWIYKDSKKENGIFLFADSVNTFYHDGIDISGDPTCWITDKDKLPNIYSMIRGALETQSFYALSDFLIERLPDHNVTKLLTEILRDG